MKRLLLAAGILGAGLVAFAPGVSGTPEIANKEKRSCVTCHTGLGKAELNDRGKYYRDKGTLEGYPEPRPGG